ncbi:MAG: nitrous oxide-stimulated promoter family protein, partial [Deltaproteobacteria bacterium]|nr:nitrous oxide-stimulated promoter family protein [Deltaproteobacteria bacterium]
MGRSVDSEMEREIKTAATMIEIFCRGHHGVKEALCPDCRDLLGYVRQRLEKCPFKGNKPRCSKCSVHCYQPEMREKIRAVMKYAGPRMLL